MKKFLLLQLLFSAFFILQPFESFSQWVQSNGLDGGATYSITSIDSLLFITTGSEDVYKKYDNGIWEKIAIGFKKVANAGNCVIMYDSDWHSPKRSFDYGQTWETIKSIFNTSYLLIIDTVIFGGTGNKYRSFDYGSSFDTVQMPTEVQTNNIISDGERLYLHYNDMEETYKIFYSEDLGESWDSISAEGMVDDNPYFDVPQMKKLNGHYWVQTESLSAPYSARRLKVYNDIYNKWIDVTSNLPMYHKYYDIFEYGGDILCSVDSYPIFSFNEADSTWIQYADATKNVTKFTIHNDELYCSTLQGVCSLDTAGNWTTHYKGFSLRDISSISVYDNNIYVTANNELFVSEDKGENFSIVDGAYGIKLITTDSVFYMMGLHDFKMSWNEGDIWYSFSDSIGGAINTSLSISPDYYYLGTRMGLYRSPTDSISWTLVENDVIYSGINVIDVESINNSVLLGSGFPGYNYIYQSLDNGITYNIFEEDQYPIRSVDQTYYLLKDSIYYSNDLGVSWDKIPYDIQGYPQCIDRRTDTIIIAGMDIYGGLLALITYNSGDKWYDIVDNLPVHYYMFGRRLSTTLMFDGRIFVGNSNYGLWYRDDLITGLNEQEIEEAFMRDRIQLQVATYPNPFSYYTTIEYELIRPSTVQLTIYDYLGKQLEVLEKNQSQGKQQIIWNAEGMPAGVYFYNIQIGNQAGTGKMVLIK